MPFLHPVSNGLGSFGFFEMDELSSSFLRRTVKCDIEDERCASSHLTRTHSASMNVKRDITKLIPRFFVCALVFVSIRPACTIFYNSVFKDPMQNAVVVSRQWPSETNRPCQPIRSVPWKQNTAANRNQRQTTTTTKTGRIKQKKNAQMRFTCKFSVLTYNSLLNSDLRWMAGGTRTTSHHCVFA